MKDTLRPVLLALVGDEESYVQLYNRTEYRIALAQALSSAPGEFIGEWQWGQDDTLIWESDFRENADRAAWDWFPPGDDEADPFDTILSDLSTELKKSRRWG